MKITLKEVRKDFVVVIPHPFFWGLSVAVLCCLVVVPAHTNMCTHKHNTHVLTQPPNPTYSISNLLHGLENMSSSRKGTLP